MTPRAGVKTTLAMERAFQGSRSQAGAHFFVRDAVVFAVAQADQRHWHDVWSFRLQENQKSKERV